MFEEFFQRRREAKALQNWQRSLLGRSLALHTNQYFSQYPRLSALTQETKDQLVGDFDQTIIAILQANNPFLAMRERLALYVVGHATLQVWCLTEAEKQVMSFSACPWISGELHHHILRASENNDELAELKWKFPEMSKDDLVSYCNTQCVVHLYYVNGLNIVRGQFDDIDEGKDWLRPFTQSMLIWQEDQVREELGLPSLLADSLGGLKHSTFMDMVRNGSKNPYFEWEKEWQ